LEEVLQRVNGSPLQEVISSVVGEVRSFCVGVPQTDDMTVLALRYWG